MYQLIRREELMTSRWSGGTTTQLAIYPPEAIYAHRNFKWRVSSAKVEDEQSEFTALPGVARILMILKGQLIIKHQGISTHQLEAFEQNHFWGDWTTISSGRVTDFNVMLRQACAAVDVFDISAEASVHLNCLSIDDLALDCFFPRVNASFLQHHNLVMTQLFYLVEGSEVAADNGTDKRLHLNCGDVLVGTPCKLDQQQSICLSRADGGTAKIVRIQILHT